MTFRILFWTTVILFAWPRTRPIIKTLFAGLMAVLGIIFLMARDGGRSRSGL